jgi:hypothetical protein
MKTQLRKHALVLALAGAAASGAFAQQINALNVNADSGVAPGSTLHFTLEGTPRSQAQLTLNDGRLVVAMRETARGVYRGSYTVKRSDNIDPQGLIRTKLTTGNRWVATNFTYPSSFLASVQPQAPAVAARINRFEARPDGAMEPGGTVRFVLNGAPGGQASMNIPGVARNIALNEQRPGVYRGSYTIRRGDNLQAFSSAAATLRVGNNAVSANLTEPLNVNTNSMGAAPSTVLPLQVLSHNNNGTIDTGLAQVRGRTAPNATVRVRVDAVPPLIGQRLGVAQQLVNTSVRADANGEFVFSFDPRSLPIPGTRYEVTLNADDGRQTAESKLTLTQRG